MPDLSKSKAGENFPVGSRLIRADLRPAVAAFYAVARTADDVADDPLLAPADKLARLDRMDAGLRGEIEGAPEGLLLRDLLSQSGRMGGIAEARRLLDAFRFDAARGRIEAWADLMAYCDDSADPVGRFLLDLHGEGCAAVAASDALCTALQVLNHLQDLRADHLALGRCYLPGSWLREEGATREELGALSLTPALRRVADRALDATDALLAEAAALPGAIRSRRLAGEAATILHLARGLSARLRREDPLAGRVRPSAFAFAWAGLRGLGVALGPRRAVPLRESRA